MLDSLPSFATYQLDADRHYLTAFNGETWNDGFDLPFCRTQSLNYDMDCPFRNVAYADMMQIVDRFDTHDQQDLVGVYEALIDNETVTPSRKRRGCRRIRGCAWLPLLEHNLADTQRIRELAELAGRFVAQSDINMKNLEPPQV